ncbi:MAG: hypothetical protein AAFX79_01425 [Planctomycetota bacterium]
MGAFGPAAIGKQGEPLDPDLFIVLDSGGTGNEQGGSEEQQPGADEPQTDAGGTQEPADRRQDGADDRRGQRSPLVRIGYREAGVRGALTEDFLNERDEGGDWSKREVYMVIDVYNLLRYPSLGVRSDAPPDDQTRDFRRKLRKIAALLLTAADWNGEVYWRRLVAFLEFYRSSNDAAGALVGAGIGTSFVSPPLGAAIAGSGLAIDTFVTGATDQLDVDEYAALRRASAVYRRKLAEQIDQEIDKAEPGGLAVQLVLRLANEYAFSYSIKGSIDAVTQVGEQLENVLEGGESAWQKYFERPPTGEVTTTEDDPTTEDDQTGPGN